jgi:hypothetical protein
MLWLMLQESLHFLTFWMLMMRHVTGCGRKMMTIWAPLFRPALLNRGAHSSHRSRGLQKYVQLLRSSSEDLIGTLPPMPRQFWTTMPKMAFL